jgi:hypothetical protein
MAMQWIASIKQTGQLTYYLDSSITGSWTQVVADAIREFNSLSHQQDLGIRFVQSNDRPSNTGG